MKTYSAWLIGVLAAAVLLPVNAAASTPSFTFNLHVPNTALASAGPFAGDTIRLTGGGSFNSANVVASGSFTIFDPSGSVVESGIWHATAFTSFVSFGGPNTGEVGGS